MSTYNNMLIFVILHIVSHIMYYKTIYYFLKNFFYSCFVKPGLSNFSLESLPSLGPLFESLNTVLQSSLIISISVT